jgi:hypothetical protein
LFIFVKEGTIGVVATVTFDQILNSQCHYNRHYQVFFLASMDPIVLEVSEQSPENNEEALIDRDNDVCDPEFIVAPISQLRSNLVDVRGKGFPFLESVQASLILYATELCFQFPKFIGWCAEKYSESERVVIDKKGSKVLCKIDVVSVRESLKIPKSFSENLNLLMRKKLLESIGSVNQRLKLYF